MKDIDKEISKMESEIIQLELYLIDKYMKDRNGYKPHTEDEDQPKRDRVIELRNIIKQLKSE